MHKGDRDERDIIRLVLALVIKNLVEIVSWQEFHYDPYGHEQDVQGERKLVFLELFALLRGHLGADVEEVVDGYD